MKIFLTALFFTLSISPILAQNANHTIEVRLNLMEKNNDQGIKEIALGISIINHSNQDIYLPYFELFAALSGIHTYQKEGKVWREIDISTHDYVRPYVARKPIVRGDTVIYYDPAIYSDDNSLTKQFTKHANQLMRHQDSLIKACYNSTLDHHQIPKEYLVEKKPLFLKANEKLENYNILSLDYLLTKKMKYKIAFNSEPMDTLRHYRSPTVYSNLLKKYQDLNSPEYIYEYKLFFPKKIKTNTIYYTTDKIITKGR